MRENAAVETIIERIVAGAQIPSRAKREELRLELRTHFEDAGTSPETLREALGRFGSAASVTQSLRQVYRWDYRLLYLAKVALSIFASSLAALAIQVVSNLRSETSGLLVRLAPSFWNATATSVAIVVVLVTAWEVCRAPFEWRRAVAASASYLALVTAMNVLLGGSIRVFMIATILVVLSSLWSRLESRLTTLPAVFVTFAAGLYCIHMMLNVAFSPGRALLAGAVLVAVWFSTIGILSRMDEAFLKRFATSEA